MISRLASFAIRAPVASSCKSFNCTATDQLLQRVSRKQTTALVRNITRQNATGPSSSNITPKQTFWSKIFGKYLLTTNTISSGVLMVIGDVVAQEIEMRNHKPTDGSSSLDYKRIWRMFIVGALMGPLHHYVYIWMDRVWPVATVRSSLQKILIDQLVMSPVCILLFFYAACFLEQKSVPETNDELISKFPYIYLMDWIFWPGAQYINFQYVHTKYRVTYVNVCTAVYNVFLSYMKHDFDLKWL